jgi:hypothetical protein
MKLKLFIAINFRLIFLWSLKSVFDVHVTVHRDKFHVIRATRWTKFSNLFWNVILHVSYSSSVHHQEFFTVRTAMVYVTQFCWHLARRIRMDLCTILILLTSCLQTCMTYTIVVCTVKNSWWWTEELYETCRVSFQSKFVKLVHLVGFYFKKAISILYITYGCCKFIT